VGGLKKKKKKGMTLDKVAKKHHPIETVPTKKGKKKTEKTKA
jgi:hypothetical protein